MVVVVSARVGSSADLDDVIRLRALASADVVSMRGGQALLDSLAPPESVASDVDTLLVGTVGDTVVGYGRLRRDGDRAELAELYCERPGRGVGVGHALLQLAIQIASGWGCHALDSQALPGDRATKNFFEAHAMVSRLIVVSRALDADG